MQNNLHIFLQITTELKAENYNVRRICQLANIETQRYYSLCNATSQLYKKEISDKELNFFINGIKGLDKKLMGIIERAEKQQIRGG
jgi:hypothetical protein